MKIFLLIWNALPIYFWKKKSSYLSIYLSIKALTFVIFWKILYGKYIPYLYFVNLVARFYGWSCQPYVSPFEFVFLD